MHQFESTWSFYHVRKKFYNGEQLCKKMQIEVKFLSAFAATLIVCFNVMRLIDVSLMRHEFHENTTSPGELIKRNSGESRWDDATWDL